MNERYLVVDPNTGEAIDTIRTNDRILRGRSLEAYGRNIQKTNELLDRGELIDMRFTEYSTSNSKEMKELIIRGMITSDERSVLMTLSHFLGAYSHAVLNIQGKAASLKEIASMMGWSHQKMHTVMQSMIDKGFIGRSKTGRQNVYFVNPWLCLRGTKINATLFQMFGSYHVMSKGGKTWDAIVRAKHESSPS